jgi:hypothetical protein
LWKGFVDAVGLRALVFGARVIDILDREIESSYSRRSGLPQHSLPHHSTLLIEPDHPIPQRLPIHAADFGRFCP